MGTPAVAGAKTNVETDIAPLAPSELLECLSEGRDPILAFRIALGNADQDADAGELRQLRAPLRATLPRRQPA